MSADLQLLRRYHDQGDTFAFRDLVQTYAGMVFATARRVTQDAALAEDVAQETFVDLARQAPRVTQSVAAWLHQVAWRRACNAVRAQVTQRRCELEAAAIVHSFQEPAWDELEPHVDAALEELPEQLRAILIDHFLQGLTQHEISERAGISQSTVSRLLGKALSEMRNNLQRKGVLCGTGLGALLTTHSAEAAPQKLTLSLGKLALASPAAGVAITTSFCAMNIPKLILASAGIAALIAVPQVLKRPQPQKTAPLTAHAQSPAAQATAKVDEPKRFRPAPVSAIDEQKVEAIIRRHKGMTKEQLSQSAELNQLLNRFIAVMENSETNTKIEDALELLQATKPGKNGMIRMDFQFLDDPHGRAWLEAAVSNDPQRIRDWVLNTLDGAVFEFALEPSLERTSGGVSVHPRPAEKAHAPAKDDEQ